MEISPILRVAAEPLASGCRGGIAGVLSTPTSTRPVHRSTHTVLALLTATHTETERGSTRRSMGPQINSDDGTLTAAPLIVSNIRR